MPWSEQFTRQVTYLGTGVISERGFPSVVGLD